MQYIMAPFGEHYDGGFGATAQGFAEAAKTIQERQASKPAFLVGENLPLSFLRRHALELYLKSAIVIIHRRLKLPYGDSASESQPHVHNGHVWRRLDSVHGIGTLYAYWKKLVIEHGATLREISRHPEWTDWSIPEGLDRVIRIIQAIDPRGTYFRYPMTREPFNDDEKALFREVAIQELFPEQPDARKKIALVLKNDDEEWTRAFVHDDSTEKLMAQALSAAVETMEGLHAMTRAELTDGW